MAVTKDPQTEAPQGAITSQDLSSLVQSIQAMTPKRKVLFSEFKSRSVFNPNGAKGKTRKLTRTCFQNGSRINPKLIFDQEIKYLNALVPGHYINRRVTIRIKEGTGGAADELRIEYPNKTNDQRLQNGSLWQGFADMLQKCLKEANVKVAD